MIAANAGGRALSRKTLGRHGPGAAAAGVLGEIATRLQYLCDVGIGYPTLDRQSRTLGRRGAAHQPHHGAGHLAGEHAVRARWPSIGLHPRDMDRINQAMLRLRDAGNTLVVVEHDPARCWRRPLIDRPAARRARRPDRRDGTVRSCAAPTPDRPVPGLGQRLAAAAAHGRPRPPRAWSGRAPAQPARCEVEFPLQRLVTVTGVSGSGKSTLVQDVLAPRCCATKATEAPGAHDRLLGGRPPERRGVCGPVAHRQDRAPTR